MAKHGVSFESAMLVFDDPHALSDLDRVVDDEERWQTIGQIGVAVILVAHTWWEDNGEDVIRLISARRTTSPERKAYETHKKSG